jgi:hypothetical protein
MDTHQPPDDECTKIEERSCYWFIVGLGSLVSCFSFMIVSEARQPSASKINLYLERLHNYATVP